MIRAVVTLLSSAMIVATAIAATDYSAPAPKNSAPRFTFSWSFADPDALKPRGGTTRGAPIVLDKAPSKEWVALQAPGLDRFERDRRAILAMAGTYRVAFDFLEVTPFNGQEKPTSPYQSWGTEKVYVDADRAGKISLVHIIEMRIEKPDGSLTEPVLNKHWRQDWQYEPKEIVEYAGRDRWIKRALKPEETQGHWSQTVYQVDESPRYASIGEWQHSASFSTWLSGDTWRPLPRREWTVRKDYQVLEGTNRHTIGPAGWVQEENNLKTVLDASRHVDGAKPYLAREYGVARYERIKNADFALADRYFEKTRAFWDQVLDTWSRKFAAHPEITLKGQVDELGLYIPLFEYAETVAAGKPKGPAQKAIDQALTAMETG
jgi:hypothetical protein